MKYLAFILTIGIIPTLIPVTTPAVANEIVQLTPERQAALEAELVKIRAELDRLGHDWVARETSRMRLTSAERRATLMSADLVDPDPDDRDIYNPGGYDRSRALLDWRDNNGNFVTNPRSQGSCGSCWSFAATAVLESAYLIAIGGGNIPFFDLSEQHVLNCINDYYSYSDDCDGGFPYHVYRMAVEHGMVEETCAPYAGIDTLPCEADCSDPTNQTYRFNTYNRVCSYENVALIKDALNNHGTLSCSMDVYDTFDAYGGGIYQASGTYEGRHAVQIIGYNDEGQYWIGKNSWGDDWGMDGFFHMAYNAGCSFGDNTYYADFVVGDRGPHAAMSFSELAPVTCDTLWFEDRSVAVSGEIISWEWDFDGDGVIDAIGPGPHWRVFEFTTTLSPWLRVEDSDGQVDVESMDDFLRVAYGGSCWDGPVWHVDGENGEVDGNGSPIRPFVKIQAAVNVAAPGDTVLIHPGVYKGIANTALDPYGDDIVIMSTGDAGDVILDGEGGNRLFTFTRGEGPNCRIENITLRHGFDSDRGGAILIDGAAPTFTGCRIDSSSLGEIGGNGGGGAWINGSATFLDCTFAACTSSVGGGAIHHTGDSLTVSNSTFSGNSGVSGGALGLSDGTALVSDSEFTGNLASTAGAAILGDNAHLYVQRSRFQGNTVQPGGTSGGCIAALNGSVMDLSDLLLIENEAPLGGAVYVYNSALELTQATVWNNTATAMGGAIVMFSSTGEVCNSILWGNQSDSNPEIMAPSGLTAHHNLISGGWDGEGILTDDPLFNDAPAGDFSLASDSPCIAAGCADCLTASDINGQSRPQPVGTSPDLGAFESILPNGVGVAGQTPGNLYLLGTYPNPFNPQVTITFATARAGRVTLNVYDCSGRYAASVADRQFPAGTHSLIWQAQDDNGNDLPTGVYLLQVGMAGTWARDKLVLLR
ncbi:MAG: hypothetical protein GY835_25975 [bacterium]|nr:hypothetical protein [bacterium]